MAIRKIISRSIGVDVIAAEDLAAGSVETAEIQNGAVTGPKLADNLNYDSGTLYLDSTNNRVGIGTTGPIQKLDVYGGNIAVSSADTYQTSINIDNTDTGGRHFGLHSTGSNSTAGRFRIYDYDANVERMTITSAGLVGIGTASPDFNLSVGNSSSVNPSIQIMSATNSNAQLLFGDGDGAAGYRGTVVYGNATDSMSFSTAGSERMRIDSSGRVGVGTSSPLEALHVTGTGGAGAIITTAGTTNGGVLKLQNTTSSNYTWRFAVGGGDNAYVGGRGLFIRDDNANATRLSINETGGVGIGVTDPYPHKLKVAAANAGQALEIHGTTGNIESYAQGASANATNLQTTANHVLLQSYMDNGGRQWNQGAQLRLSNAHYATGTPHCRFVLNTSQGGYNNGGMIHAEGGGSYAAGSLVFSTGWASNNIPDEIFRIRNGRMLIGTGSIDLPSASVAGAGFDLTNNSELRCSVAGTGNSTQIRFLNPNGEVGAIRTNGTATSYITSSDYRLKENVEYDFDATTRLKQLKPARFNFIADADTTVDGFLAHEVQDIIPEAISGTKDAVENIGTITDQDNNIIEENIIEPSEMSEGQTWTQTGTQPVYQGIDQAKLVPLLVKSLQEALTEIDSLKARLDDAGL